MPGSWRIAGFERWPFLYSSSANAYNVRREIRASSCRCACCRACSGAFFSRRWKPLSPAANSACRRNWRRLRVPPPSPNTSLRCAKPNGWSMPNPLSAAPNRRSIIWAATPMPQELESAFRVAISNERLLSGVNGEVTFLWKDYRHKNKQKPRPMTLSGDEFIRRFLLHTLPAGFQRIRHFGFLANRHRKDVPETAGRSHHRVAAADRPMPPTAPRRGAKFVMMPALSHPRLSHCLRGTARYHCVHPRWRALFRPIFPPVHPHPYSPPWPKQWQLQQRTNLPDVNSRHPRVAADTLEKQSP